MKANGDAECYFVLYIIQVTSVHRNFVIFDIGYFSPIINLVRMCAMMLKRGDAAVI